jgi:5-methyltetrahydropteroyltriglutamate--homocysteine methyltransferase
MFRSDVVGSLLRPDYLSRARERLEAGQTDASAFKAVEDRAVDEAVRLQEEAGLDVLTDGEQRRYAFFGHLVDGFEGFDKLGGWAIPFHDEEGHELTYKRPVVVERLRWRRGMCAEEYTYLRARTKTPAKVTLVSTQQAAAYYDPQRSAGAYPTRDAYLADLVDLTRHEIGELVRLGCTYVQIDAPQYGALLDPKMRDGYRQRGSDVDEMIDRTIELDNAVIDSFARQGVTFGLHICRGNNQSMFYASGGYDPIAERVLRRTRFDRFLLEYDDERSGTFAPLRFVPEDRVVVLGLVTTKKPRLETQAELERRIEEAARVVPLERLALSPQCGFASTWEGNRISPELQRQKLELVGRTARAVWGQSGGRS